MRNSHQNNLNRAECLHCTLLNLHKVLRTYQEHHCPRSDSIVNIHSHSYLNDKILSPIQRERKTMSRHNRFLSSSIPKLFHSYLW